MSEQPSFVASLLAGGMAGTAVDVALYPLDTIKTRLQSPEGFVKSGGLRGVYNGLSAAAVGSAPGAALFFSSYEAAKHALDPDSPLAHMAAASVAETMACLVRVPTENVKQKMQAGLHGTATETMNAILKNSGMMGFYTGYLTTVVREIPFSFIQFPIYEGLKAAWAKRRGGPLEPYEAAGCGSVSGAFAAAVTTPMDVVKTRLMLGTDKHGETYRGLGDTFRRVYTEEGAAALMSGVTPRVTWIGIGGFVFFGVYEGAKTWLMGLGA
ncbi:unnamed protein product [Ectocarpus sp. 6 AP-2014]|uniref:Uncharacterized protein n=1 Tax=Ectocarpus siliculosus TaxID=2880 RepID=D8LFT9_ECTSI|nr:conserved unknown protein [Ectocarpus siliculosus]|eukprot:CBN75663.1 conserved unknown protein [Ectocarpus siliculosus]